jgi:hypothetical protein
MSEEKTVTVKLASPAKVDGKFCKAGDIVTVSEAVAAHLPGWQQTEVDSAANEQLTELEEALNVSEEIRDDLQERVSDLENKLVVANEKLTEYGTVFDAFGEESRSGLRRIEELVGLLKEANYLLNEEKSIRARAEIDLADCDTRLKRSEAAREKLEAELEKAAKPAKATKNTQVS